MNVPLVTPTGKPVNGTATPALVPAGAQQCMCDGLDATTKVGELNELNVTETSRVLPVRVRSADPAPADVVGGTSLALESEVEKTVAAEIEAATANPIAVVKLALTNVFMCPPEVRIVDECGAKIKTLFNLLCCEIFWERTCAHWCNASQKQASRSTDLL